MGKISLSTNVDLQNYARRIDDVAKAFNPLGIEIFSLPQNYAPKIMLELPETAQPYEGKFTVLNRQTAKELGKMLKNSGVAKIQFHYPWQKTLLDMNSHDIALTYAFCNIILEESGAERLTINHHNSFKYPIPSAMAGFKGKYRKELLKMLKKQTGFAKSIGKQMGTACQLVVENNPAVSIDDDKKTGEKIVDVFDLVVEDYIGREGLDGMTLDYSHAWCVVDYFNRDLSNPFGARFDIQKGAFNEISENMEWCRRQYNGVPLSAQSIENYVKKASHFIKWVHIGDEPNAFSHSGGHVGEGTIDFKECAELLNSLLPMETPATIEVKDGHTDAGFKRILEHDLPSLRKLFG
jgi:hypothetical protein